MVNDIHIARKYIALKQRAEDKGLQFNLTLRSVANMMNARKCYFTGVSIRHDTRKDAPNKLTIDRVDASKGYIKGNVVACSLSFNQKKKDLTISDIELLYKKVNGRKR